ncbi:MAG: hypothetical protein ACJ73S_16470 [Mycobacteriales bacterium]
MALTAACTAVASVAALSAPAQAVSPTDVLGYITQAYGVYQKLAGNELTLEGAVNQLEADIANAQTAIVAEIDAVTVAHVQACARSAYITAQDLPTMSPDRKSAFAGDTLSCAEEAKFQLESVSSTAAADKLGLVLNVIGPIALFARTAAGLSNGTLKQDLITGNNENIARLAPSCFATPLTGDNEPGQPLEWQLVCTAYNGDMGFDSAFGVIDFSYASARALRNTSSPVSSAALPLLTAMN